MVNLPGNLYIREVKGRNGGFSVGRLVTDIGEFVLRDPFLGRYGEGCYRGEFGIGEVPRQLCGGRPLRSTEIRATLAGVGGGRSSGRNGCGPCRFGGPTTRSPGKRESNRRSQA